MKKLCVALIACLSTVVAFCNEATAEETTQPVAAPKPTYKDTRQVEYVNFAFNGEEYIDVIGLRMTYMGRCNDVTGLDLSVAGEAQNAYGLQLAIARNKVYDRAEALQIAIFNNSANRLDGAQISLVNDTSIGRGVQFGLVNIADDFTGLQLGLINTTNTMEGYQLGAINVIKSSEWFSFLPLINIGFRGLY
jgi:hypothetical protein